MTTPEPEPIHSWEYLQPLAYMPKGPPHISATISGTCVSQDPGWRPPARTDATIGDRGLPAAPLALEGPPR